MTQASKESKCFPGLARARAAMIEQIPGFMAKWERLFRPVTVVTTGVSTRLGIGGRRHRRQRRTLPTPTRRLRLWESEIGFAVATSPGDAWKVFYEETHETPLDYSFMRPKWTPRNRPVRMFDDVPSPAFSPSELIRTRGRCFIMWKN